MEIPPDLIITVTDIRRAGFCIARGAKPWFDGRDDVPSFREFLKNGILATELAATGDGMALQVVERALKAQADG